MIAFESPFASALNHLLEAEPWARGRLVPFAGETLDLCAPPLPRLRFVIAADGLLAAASPGRQPGVEPSLVITLRPEALAAATKGEDQLLRSIGVAGNARLASEVMFLARHLRWDAAEDAARFIGDAAAHRQPQSCLKSGLARRLLGAWLRLDRRRGLRRSARHSLS